MSDNIMARLAVLESEVQRVMPLIPKVAELDSDIKKVNASIEEIKAGQKESAEERKEQYISIIQMITELREKSKHDLEEALKPVGESITSFTTAYKTTIFIFGCIGSVIALAVGIISVLPK